MMALDLLDDLELGDLPVMITNKDLMGLQSFPNRARLPQQILTYSDALHTGSGQPFGMAHITAQGEVPKLRKMGTAEVSRVAAAYDSTCSEEDMEELKTQAKRDHRKKQKRDYARRKRHKDKMLLEELKEKQEQLQKKKEQHKEDIKKLQANVALFKSYMASHEDHCVCKNRQNEHQSHSCGSASAEMEMSCVPQQPSRPVSDAIPVPNGSREHAIRADSAKDLLEMEDEDDAPTDDRIEFDLFSYLGMDPDVPERHLRVPKSSPGEDYSGVSGDISDTDITNRAPIPNGDESMASSYTSPVSGSPPKANMRFWMDLPS